LPADRCTAAAGDTQTGRYGRDWQRDSPTTGCIGLARSLLRFITGLLADQDDRGDVPATLERLRDEHPALAGAAD
jgi:hypothetical protein